MSKQAEPQFKDIQAWLHTFVVEPGSQSEALKAAEKKSGFEEGSAENLILPSPTLEPRERIQIYRGMYLLRMYDALEIDFPSILDRVGEEKFRELVADYVGRHPSQSYTLDHLGRNFSPFLLETDACGEGAYLSELAKLEWSLCMVAIAHDSPRLAMTDLAEIPPDQFVEVILKPVPALHLLEFEHNVNDQYKAWVEDQDPPPLSKETTYLVNWRQNLKVWRMELSAGAFAFLQLLIDGKCLGQALDQVIESHGLSEEDLFELFQTWVTEGFFQADYRLLD